MSRSLLHGAGSGLLWLALGLPVGCTRDMSEVPMPARGALRTSSATAPAYAAAATASAAYAPAGFAGAPSAAAAAAPASAPSTAGSSAYTEGQRVKIEWRGRWYSGSILRVNPDGTYRIHYSGWSSSWDENVPPRRLRAR